MGIKAHIWNGNKGDIDIHNHTWSFYSVVVSGI